MGWRRATRQSASCESRKHDADWLDPAVQGDSQPSLSCCGLEGYGAGFLFQLCLYEKLGDADCASATPGKIGRVKEFIVSNHADHALWPRRGFLVE